MPTLDWIGKEAVVRHHQEVPYRLLEPVAELSLGDTDSGNLIVQGDNLHALKSLLPRYAGQVKCIYIDPPYNTGNEGWVYNDNVNSPEIRKTGIVPPIVPQAPWRIAAVETLPGFRLWVRFNVRVRLLPDCSSTCLPI